MSKREPSPRTRVRRRLWLTLALLGVFCTSGCEFIENELILLDRAAPELPPPSSDAPGAPGHTAGY